MYQFLISIVIVMLMANVAFSCEQQEDFINFLIVTETQTYEQDQIRLCHDKILIHHLGKDIEIPVEKIKIFTMNGEIFLHNGKIIMHSNSIHPYTGKETNKIVTVRPYKTHDVLTEKDILYGSKKLYE